MGKKILLIEDDITMLMLLEALLQLEGFEVLKPGNMVKESQILEQIRQSSPDLLLCDVYLKGLNGLDLLKQIRSQSDFHALRILMSSGLDFNERCIDEGANGFILKPYMPEELIKTIHQILADTPTTN